MFLRLVLIIIITLPRLAYCLTEVVDGIKWKYTVSNGAATVGGGSVYEPAVSTSTTGAITIPSKLGGYPVTSIGYCAFNECSGLTSVTIPDSVKSIGEAAFSGCRRLTNVTMPNSVTSIGNYAFSGCRGLASVTIPNSVKSIGDSTFYWCSGLTSVTIPDGVKSIGSEAFYGCSGLTSVTIPNRVTSIGSCAFSGCSGLTNITLPFVGSKRGNSGTADSLFGYIFGTYSSAGGTATKQYYSSSSSSTFYIPSSLRSVTITDESVLGYGAFYNCSGLTNVTLSDSVTNIGSYAFNGCSGLTSMTIPDSVTNIGNSAFYGCSGFTSVMIPNSVTNIGVYAFSGCSGLTNVTIPNSVTSIGSQAFYNCIGLASVTIPNSVTSIGDSAFYWCSGLTSVTIPDGVKSIGNYAFYWCSGLTSVTIPDGVKSIGNYAFYGCSGLTSVTIPNSVTSIGSCAFSGCSGLTNITLPFVGSKRGNSGTADSLFGYIFGTDSSTDGTATKQYYSSSSSSTFYIPSSLRSVTITDESVLGYGAFYNCSGLTNVTISDSVTNIGSYAFNGCNGLTGVTIPNSVTSIGNYAFSGCSGLLQFVVSDSNPNFRSTNGLLLTKDGKTLLSGVNGDVTLPDSVTSIGSYAFSGCSGLTSVTIPNSVTSIGSYAFSGCSGLTSVTIPDGVKSIGNYAFSGCSGLTSVTIPNRVTSIGSCAFSGCSGLTNITLPFVGSKRGNSGIKDSLFGYIFGTDSYTGGTASKQYYSPSSSSTFYIPSALRAVTVADESVLGYGAFYNCSGITNVTISDSVTSIGSYAFYGCSGLTSVIIPDSVTNVGNYAFAGVQNLDTAMQDGYRILNGWLVGYADDAAAQIPGVDDLKGIVGGALEGCTAITELVFSDAARIRSIGDAALKGCTELQTLVLPSSLEAVGNEAFMGCSYLDNVIVPGSVRSVGARAFKNCTGFTAAQIEHGVQSIGEEAFYGDWQISEVDIPSTVTNIGANAFGGDSSIIRIGLRGDSRAVSAIFSNYKNIREATVKHGNGRIVDGLFKGCSQLTDVHFQGNCPDMIGNGTNLYNGTKSALVTYVEQSSTGWDGTPGSHQLPQAWPLSGNYRRSIAYWDVPTYLVRFDSNGGTLGVQSTYQYSEKPFSLPPEPVQTGYRFAGWWTKRSGGLRVTSDTVFIEGVYTTLYAHWLKGHWVFLDPNGGTVTNDFVTYVEQTVYGVLPAAVRTGYAFGGWTYNGQTVLPTTELATTADHTITAQWEAYKYSVRFNANGGEGEMEDEAMEYDRVDELAKNSYVRRGYAFMGWSESPDGEAVFADGESVSNLTDEENGVVTLYAVWQKDGSNLSFVSVGDADWSLDSSVRHGDSVSWRSGEIGDDECTAIQSVVNGPGVVSFWWKVGCESFRTLRLDSLAFSIDGVEKSWINWNKDWAYLEFEVEGEGPHLLEWTYAKDESGYTDPDCGWVSDVVWVPRLETINDYLNCTNMVFTSNPVSWSGVRDVSHDGFGAMRSGTIGDNAESRIDAVVEGGGVISFWWCSDCEESFKTYVLDHLSFRIDGVEQAFINGNAEWEKKTFRVRGGGVHTLSWVYVKDEEDSSGCDCAWLDEVVWLSCSDPIPLVTIDMSKAEINEVIDDVGFADSAVKAAIGGSAFEYNAFKTWADGVKGTTGDALAGEAAVVANAHAAAAYLLGAERLFENEPTVEIGEVAVGDGMDGTGDLGTITVSVMVKDGERAAKVDAAKVAEMFEATSDLGDWDGAAKLEPEVEVIDDGITPRFYVSLGSSVGDRAFLRIRK